jgi:hypothetical protein
MIKRLERLKNAANKYMADLRPTSHNGSWSQVDDPVYIYIYIIFLLISLVSHSLHKLLHSFPSAACCSLNLGCLHPVACVKSGDRFFYSVYATSLS